MIPANATLNLSVKTNLCANGETVEARLILGERQVGRSVYVNGTTASLDEALSRLLALLASDFGDA